MGDTGMCPSRVRGLHGKRDLSSGTREPRQGIRSREVIPMRNIHSPKGLGVSTEFQGQKWATRVNVTHLSCHTSVKAIEKTFQHENYREI